MKIDKKLIKELVDHLKEFNLTELEYTEKDTKIKVSKNKISLNQPNTQISNFSSETDATSASKKIVSGTQITSPIIGTAYHAPEPGAKKFVDVGKISDRLRNRQDLFDRDYKFEIINIDKNYPKFLRENKIKYKNWIL